MREELDPELADFVDEWAATPLPEWHQLSVQRARELEDELFSPEQSQPVETVRDLAFDAGTFGPEADGEDATGGSATGSHDVRVRVYADAVPPAPVVVFFHGGGWTLGTLSSAGDICRALARRADCVVASVEYRLAPEHPFPAALDDAAAAVAWVAEVAPSLGGDPNRLHVAGTSAGGNLAAATALRLREFGGPDLAGQLLLYPMVDADFERDSYRQQADGPLLTRADVRWFWEQYVRTPVDRHSPFAAPLRADDHGDLPPATIVTAGHDPLRDEGVAYAEALSAAGVAVDHRHYPGMAHGFLSLTDEVPRADEAMDAVAEAIGSPPG